MNVTHHLARVIPKDPLHPEWMCTSNTAPVDVSGTYNLFYCVYSLEQSNSQFFQAMTLWGYSKWQNH